MNRPGVSRRRPVTTMTLAVTVGGVVGLAYLAALVFWPLAAMAIRSFRGTGIDGVAAILARPSLWSVVGFTVMQAALSALVTLVVGLPAAHLLARFRFRGRALVRAAVVVPFVMPTLVVASAFQAVLDTFGVVGQGGLAPVIAAHVFFNLAVVVRIVGGRWASIGAGQAAAAAVLGASPWRAWRDVTLPQLRPVLLGAFLVIFMFSFTSYGVIRVLGGLRMATVETEIYRYAVANQRFDVAAVLSGLQILVVATLSVGAGWLQRSQSTPAAPSTGAELLVIDRWSRRLELIGVLGVLAVVQGLPIVVMVERSLRVGDRMGFDNYRALTKPVPILPVTAVGALANSLLFAALAAVIVAVVGVLSVIGIVGGGRLGRWLEGLAFVPLGVSAVTLGFGYLVGFAAFDLRRSLWLLPLAHSVLGLPFVLAAMVPSARSVDPRIRQAAATLGASPARVVATVDWPLVRRALATGVGFAAAVSLGEFGASSFLARGASTYTAPLAIFRLLGTPGDQVRGQAMALSVVVGAMVAGLAAIIEAGRDETASLL